MIFTYKSVTGNVAIEISEEWSSILIDMDRQEYNNNQTETRRHASIDAMPYEGEFFASEDKDISALTCASDAELKVIDAVETLTENQKKLVDAVYREGYSPKEYAEHKGVSKAAVSKQQKQITEKIKKFIAEG